MAGSGVNHGADKEKRRDGRSIIGHSHEKGTLDGAAIAKRSTLRAKSQARADTASRWDGGRAAGARHTAIHYGQQRDGTVPHIEASRCGAAFSSSSSTLSRAGYSHSEKPV